MRRRGECLLLEDAFTGREGCFCITSNRDMLAFETLRIYRAKNAIGKLFHSLKSEIEVKPVRAWSDDAVYGVLLIGFIAQVMISLTRHFVKLVKRMSTKFMIASLKKLTVMVVLMENDQKRMFYSNFDPRKQGLFGGIPCRSIEKTPEIGRFQRSGNLGGLTVKS